MNKILLSIGLIIAMLFQSSAKASGGPGQYVFDFEKQRYPYQVRQSGDNYSFEFAKNPGRDSGRFKAAAHVFRSVYEDDTIDPNYSEFFMKETAKCFVFEGRFYTYRACFLPNDFSTGNETRFWGFVNRLPNKFWFLTRHGLPLLGVIALMGFLFRTPKPRT